MKNDCPNKAGLSKGSRSKAIIILLVRDDDDFLERKKDLLYHDSGFIDMHTCISNDKRTFN